MKKTEAETRSELIDKKLAHSGWNVADTTQVVSEMDIFYSEEGLASDAGSRYLCHEISDYALLGKDGKVLAIVEAKRASKSAAVGREQAKQYCHHIHQQMGGELPFCFYTNGHEVYFWDLDNYPPRKIVGFPTRDDLERFQYIRRNRKPLTQELINTSIAGRDYQINFEGSQLEKQVINKGTNALIVKEFMEECIKDGRDLLPGGDQRNFTIYGKAYGLMKLNRERHDKGNEDHFHGATKMVLKHKPIEYDGFMLAKVGGIDPFENEYQDEFADFNSGERATITRMGQS